METTAVVEPSGASGSVALWERLAPGSAPAGALDALFGTGIFEARAEVGRRLVLGEAAADLLDAMPKLIRNLAMRTETKTQRANGHLPGPIRWAETASARAGSAGRTEVWVCSVTERVSDGPENRALVSALEAIVKGAADVRARSRSTGREATDTDRRIAECGAAARAHLGHRSLAGVRRSAPNGRSLAAVRSGRRATDYAAALAVIDESNRPKAENVLAGIVDDRAQIEHLIMALVLEHLESTGVRVPQLRARGGRIGAGTVFYQHHSRAVTVAPLTIGPIEVLVGDEGHAQAPSGGAEPIRCSNLAGAERAAWAVIQRLEGRTPPPEQARLASA